MVINVTKKHIKDGTVKSCNSCPVALAIKEQFPKMGVLVTRHQISIFKIASTDYQIKLFKSPRSVQRFISSFDKGNSKLKPFSFILSDREIEKLSQLKKYPKKILPSKKKVK